MVSRKQLAGMVALAGAIFPTSALADANGVYGPADPAAPAVEIGDAPRAIPRSLAESARMAVEGYPAILSAEANLRAARSDVRGAKWLRFPSLSVEGLAATKGSENASTNTLYANVTLEQPIWTGGKIGGTVERAEAAWLVRRGLLEETAREVAQRVVDSYYTIALNARRKDVLTRSLEQHRLLVQSIANRVAQEVSPRADLELANSRAAQIEQELASAGAQLQSAYSQLVQLVGKPVDLGNVPAYDPVFHHPSEQGAIEKALQCEPKIQRLKAEVLVADADRRVAKASLFPQVLGQLSHNEVTGSRAGLALRMQTGNGLSQLSALQSASARVDSAEFEIQTAERDLREALRLDFVTNSAAGDRIRASLRAAEASTVVTESYKRQFIAGRRTWLDVMNALRETMTSELTVADAEIAAEASSARILLRTCAWQPELPGTSDQDKRNDP